MTTSVITRRSPFHSIFSSNGGVISTESLVEDWSKRFPKRISEASDPVQREVVFASFFICEVLFCESDNSILLSTNEGMHNAEHKRHEHERCEAR